MFSNAMVVRLLETMKYDLIDMCEDNEVMKDTITDYMDRKVKTYEKSTFNR